MRILAAILALAVAGGGSPAWGGSADEAGPAAEAHPQARSEPSSTLSMAPSGQRPAPPEPGRLRLALGALLLAPEEGAIPPEPRRETPPGSRKSFLRSRGAAVLMIVAGAILVGSVAKNSILRDS